MRILNMMMVFFNELVHLSSRIPYSIVKPSNWMRRDGTLPISRHRSLQNWSQIPTRFATQAWSYVRTKTTTTKCCLINEIATLAAQSSDLGPESPFATPNPARAFRQRFVLRAKRCWTIQHHSLLSARVFFIFLFFFSAPFCQLLLGCHTNSLATAENANFFQTF